MPDPLSNNGFAASPGASPAPAADPIVSQPVAPVSAAPAAPVQSAPVAPTEPAFNSRGMFSDALRTQQATAGQPQGAGSAPYPAAAPAAGIQAPISPTSPGGIRERLQSRGYDVSHFDSDESLVDAVTSGYDKLQQVPHYQQQLAYYQQQLQAAQTAQAPQNIAPAPAAPAKKGWNAPEFDPKWMDLVTLDEQTGRYIPGSPYISADLAQKVNDYNDWRKQDGQRFFSPERPNMIWESIEDRLADREEKFLQRLVEAREQEQLRAQADQSAAAYLNEKKAELFNLDPQGNPLGYTEKGKALDYFIKVAYQKFQDYGIENPNPLHIQMEAIQGFESWNAQQQLQQYQQQMALGQQGFPGQYQTPAPGAIAAQAAAQTQADPAQQMQLPPGVALNAAGRPYNTATGHLLSAEAIKQYNPPPPAPPPTPAQRNQAQKDAYLGRLPPGAGHQPGNAVAEAAELSPLTASGRPKSFMEMAMPEFAARGIQVGNN